MTFCGGTIKIFANVANSVAGNLFIESVNESDKGECIRNEVRVENRGGWQKGENFCKVKMAIKIRRGGKGDTCRRRCRQRDNSGHIGVVDVVEDVDDAQFQRKKDKKKEPRGFS